jgi:hypothetical protein|tara:strand:- start:272 stop:517 length:246 start_codon:yes stop_codon:yes gene_type:complete
MSVYGVLRIPYIWGLVGLIVGAVLGANDLSVWLIAILMIAFLVFMKLTGPAQKGGEGSLFAGGSLLMIGWILGFSIRSLAI